jgi:hypothetical protein
MFNHLREVDRVQISLENIDKKFEKSFVESKTEGEKMLLKQQITIGNLKRNIG